MQNSMNGKNSKEVSSPSSRVLVVQNAANGASAEPSELCLALVKNNFEVVAKSTVSEALASIAREDFVALICDLHLPAAGDGFTLVNAMRHVHPNATTIIMSDYPALRESLSDLLPQADEVLVSPVPLQDLVELLKSRLKAPKHRAPKAREPVSTILERESSGVIRDWLKRVKEDPKLTKVELSDSDRKGHLRAVLHDLVIRLRLPRNDEGKAAISMAAVAHGEVRKAQGYTSSMLVEESRILQVCIFKSLRNNLNAVDLALVLTDVMTIADEVDSQLSQTMSSFASFKPPSTVSRGRKAVS